MFLEYNWTVCRYQPRFHDQFIDIRGWRSFADMREAVSVLNECGLTVGRKTASRTWEIIPVPENTNA
jgi:hypothetical protein